jgi:hypothetical protein
MRRQGRKVQPRVKSLYLLYSPIHAVVRKDHGSHRLGGVQESLQSTTT